jgi:hypothetical protein
MKLQNETNIAITHSGFNMKLLRGSRCHSLSAKDALHEPIYRYVRRNVRPPLHRGPRNHAVITDAWLRAYGFHFATPADCAGPIGWAKEFATGAHRLEAPDEAARRAVATRPALAIWGMEDRTLPSRALSPAL